MTQFHETPAGVAFIATAASRETSPEVMKAIASVSANTEQADALWSGDGIDIICGMSRLVGIATDFGKIETADLYWGGCDLAQIISGGELA